MIREYSKSNYRRVDPGRWLATNIAQARKFVLDEQMAAFMADLANASFPRSGVTKATTVNTKRAHRILENMRHMARLPHAKTWIEFDLNARVNQARSYFIKDIDGNLIDPKKSPERGGW